MSQMTADELTVANAFVTVLKVADPRDRRLVAILAVDRVGNREFVRCATHGLPTEPAMTFTEAYQHMTQAPSRCQLYGDHANVEATQ